MTRPDSSDALRRGRVGEAAHAGVADRPVIAFRVLLWKGR